MVLYPNETKEEESASSSENKEKSDDEKRARHVEIVDADVEKGDEECLTPVYLEHQHHFGHHMYKG